MTVKLFCADFCKAVVFVENRTFSNYVISRFVLIVAKVYGCYCKNGLVLISAWMITSV